MLKHLTSLNSLDLKIGNVDGLYSLRKLSDVIEKMSQLAHLALNIEKYHVPDVVLG